MPPLYTESPSDAALDVAISHALLRRAADAREEALRVWCPPPALSFGRLDLLSPSHGGAVAAARAARLEPVRRLAGGRAAAIGPDTACFGWASVGGAMSENQARYETTAAVVLDALGLLGVTARIGELDGEWCPGAWSVLVGEAKVGGLAQRVIRGAAWAEAVVVVSGSAGLRAGLDRVQRALGVAWAPETLAAVSDLAPGVSTAAVQRALAGALGARWEPVAQPLPASVWNQARGLRADHVL